jgi:circadian clock protein KaiB
MEDAAAVQLVLFIANDSPRSAVARANLDAELAARPPGAFQLEIVNVCDDPDRALAERVLVTPTLLAPAYARRLVGDLREQLQLSYFLLGLSPVVGNRR